MKLELIQYFQTGDFNGMLTLIKELMDARKNISILPERFQEGGMAELESDLYGSLIERDKDRVLPALDNLAKAYRNYGIKPTISSGGYIYMIDYLNDVEEFVLAVSE